MLFFDIFKKYNLITFNSLFTISKRNFNIICLQNRDEV